MNRYPDAHSFIHQIFHQPVVNVPESLVANVFRQVDADNLGTHNRVEVANSYRLIRHDYRPFRSRFSRRVSEREWRSTMVTHTPLSRSRDRGRFTAALLFGLVTVPRDHEA